MKKTSDVPEAVFGRMALAERIRTIMGEDSQRDFAGKIGVGQTTLNQYLAGKTEPSWSTLVLMSEQTGCSLDWLMTGQAPRGGSAAFMAQTLHIQIDRYDLHASAGNGSKQFHDPPATQWTIPREMLRGFTGNAEKLMSTDVVGDSMLPTLQDGQPVIVDRAAKFDREGVYMLTVGDDLFVKRLRRVPGPDGMALSMISDNPAYPEVTLGADTQESVRIIGRVIWPPTSRRL